MCLTAIEQHLLRSVILQSAKTKFDLNAFRRQFPLNTDQLIIELIQELDGTRSYEDIAGQISRSQTAFLERWSEDELIGFLDHLFGALHRERKCARLMSDMLELGHSEEEVIIMAVNACGDRKPLYLVN